MKKYFYLAAVSAMMLTACSSDKDVLEPTPKPSTPTVVAQQQAVAFDTYLAGTTASTRAGETGVMTTQKLKEATAGFGVFAYYQDNVNYSPSSLKPDFMYNEQVTWNGGWTYSPLKYWPNETTNDSQDPTATATSAKPLDKISFFAYAPYVNPTTAAGTIGASTTALVFTPAETNGITGIFANSLSSDPLVEWKYTNNPDENVDLLWGVAPAGFTYTNVSGGTTSVPVGMPLKDLVKPDKDQKVKFLFQHALSRIGLSVVSAIDQIAAGDDAGTFSKDPTTKVLIKSVTLTGKFGTAGVLNLNNTSSNVAKWDETTKDAGSAALFTINGATVDGESGSTAGNFFLAPDLRFVGTQITAVGSSAANFAAVNTGVLPSEQALLAGDADLSKAETTPDFTFGKVYYQAIGGGDKGYEIASVSHVNNKDLFIKDESGNYTQVYKTTDTPIALDGNSPTYYEVTPGTAATAALTANDYYYKEAGTAAAGDLTYTKIKATGTETDYNTVNYYPVEGTGNLTADATAVPEKYTGTCYSGLIPRYFMVIPTGATNITVNIKYAVVTKDEKLAGNVSNVENDITKTVSVNLENGKSYNLKLILGLTSVKLDATVADWKVADETEFFLPQNNE